LEGNLNPQSLITQYPTLWLEILQKKITNPISVNDSRLLKVFLPFEGVISRYFSNKNSKKPLL
jgi:hypothetical protein